MKITLISPYSDITTLGVRLISSYLKKHGHQTQLILLPDPHGDEPREGACRYNEDVLDEVVSLCRESDVVGITLMTIYFDGVVDLTKKLNSSLKAPVIWGGIHPTIRPEECLEYADIICVGDGEEAMLELMSRMEDGDDYSGVANLCLHANGQLINNPVRPLNPNLDIYPIPDYSREDHHILFDNHIVPITAELEEHFLFAIYPSAYLKKAGYQTMTSRGCPHRCTYCVNDALRSMYRKKNYFRWRSTEHVMKELLWVKENMPFVGHILLSDDTFLSFHTSKIKEFCQKYKEKIDLPFSCLVSPPALTEEKIELLIDAGLIHLHMGMESGSKRIQELFNRKNMSNKTIIKAATIINKYQHKILPPHYDFIIDVPYETDNERIETLRLISEIPKPFQLNLYSLIFFPGTKLHDLARHDGLIEDEKKQIYRKSFGMRERNYINLLFTLAKKGNFPSGLLKLLTTPLIVKLFNSAPMQSLFGLLWTGIKNLKKQRPAH